MIYKDTAGNEWTISLTVGSILKLKKALKIDLASLDAPYPSGGTTPLISALFTDISLLVDVLYVLLKEQADKYNLDDVGFAETLDGQTLDAAIKAFWGEVEGFFRPHRPQVSMAIQKAMALATAVNQSGVEQIEAMSVEEILKKFGNTSTD